MGLQRTHDLRRIAYDSREKPLPPTERILLPWHDRASVEEAFLSYATHDGMVFESGEHRRAWLITVATNHCRDLSMRELRQMLYVIDANGQADDDAETVCNRGEDHGQGWGRGQGAGMGKNARTGTDQRQTGRVYYETNSPANPSTRLQYSSGSASDDWQWPAPATMRMSFRLLPAD